MFKAEEIRIVVVEDDEGHARLIERNLRRGGISNELVMCKNGQEALDRLLPPDGAVPGPCLVLLDLNMPVIDGYEVLRRLRADVRTRSMMVVVLTSTDDAREVQRCYELGTNIYISKPVDYDKFSEAIRRIGLLLSVVRLPE